MAVWDKFLTENDKKMLSAQGGGLGGRHSQRSSEFGERPAVLVIDMNEGAVGEDRPVWEVVEKIPGAMGDKAWAAMRHMQDLLPKARAAGIPVIYSKHIFRAIHDMPGAKNPDFVYSELNPLSEIHEVVAMQPGDMLIEKQRASVFFQTGLVYMLMNKKIDNLILTGNSSSGCVRATAVDAGGYNFKVSIVEDATFDRIEASHAMSLFDMNMKYGDVVSIGDVYEYIASVKDGQRVPAGNG